MPFAFAVVRAQSFQPSVIASAGTSNNFLGGSIQWTIGEVDTETFTSGNYSFTQGFNQPDSSNLPTEVSKISTPQFTVSYYPNPVIGNLNLFFSKSTGTYILQIYGMVGEKISETSISGSSEPIVIPFNKYSEGMYILTLINSETSQKVSFKVIKSK